MSAYTRRKASLKYAKHIQWERAARQVSNNTAMSGSERIRKYRERKKLEAAQRAADGASTMLPLPRINWTKWMWIPEDR
jgi:hypothetical protein